MFKMLSRFVISQVKHNSCFLFGLAFGLWVALVAVPMDDDGGELCEISSTAPLVDDYEPHREERPLGPGGAIGKSLQRPRYYSTELGIRAKLLAGTLTSQAALDSRAKAINQTAAKLQPALRFFITASTLQGSPGLSNVVGFTDTREMLKPFHALKYLADNYLEEYDFFFLVSDTTYVNAGKLSQLVSRLSVSQDIYMGVVAEDDSQYCTLESGILLSNSVLRAVHGELDWCVRNSYSAHHHENLGRCVLHAGHKPCMKNAQGEHYISTRVSGVDLSGHLKPELADSVTVYPLSLPEHFFEMHAYVSRVFLERDRSDIESLRRYLVYNSARHPVGAKNSTWPGGLRADAGHLPDPPSTRFDHLRWTAFTEDTVLMPDELHAAANLSGQHRRAVQLVLGEVTSWARHRWGPAVRIVEGAWRWEAARALRYRVLLQADTLRLVEAVRPLGAARLVPVRYVTESARVWAVVGVEPRHVQAALTFLLRFETVALKQDGNTALVLVLLPDSEDMSVFQPLRDSMVSLSTKYRSVLLHTAETSMSENGMTLPMDRRILIAASPKLPKDAIVLMLPISVQFNQDFLNRVRMNTIPNSQWFLVGGFARYAIYDNPVFATSGANGGKPTVDTGRFNMKHVDAVAFCKQDLDNAVSSWLEAGRPPAATIPSMLSRSALHCLSAPEPGLVRDPPARATAALTSVQGELDLLDLGARSSLAKLLLQSQANLS